MLEWPPSVVDASRGVSADKFRKELDNAASIVKSAYWYVLIMYVHT